MSFIDIRIQNGAIVASLNTQEDCEYCESPCVFSPNYLQAQGKVFPLCDRCFGHVYPCDRCGELLHEQDAFAQPLDTQRDHATGYAGHFHEGCI